MLDRAAAAKPADRRLQLERGLLALELGDAAKAEKLLRQAHDPKAPDWRLHSALGAALASRGKQQEAQVEFAKALALAPDQPSVLNNLALSYALDGKAAEAEQLLRKAQRSAGKAPQVQENLALVLGPARPGTSEARSAGRPPCRRPRRSRTWPICASWAGRGPRRARPQPPPVPSSRAIPRARRARACRSPATSWADPCRRSNDRCASLALTPSP